MIDILALFFHSYDFSMGYLIFRDLWPLNPSKYFQSPEFMYMESSVYLSMY